MISSPHNIFKKIFAGALFIFGFATTIRAQFIDLNLNIDSKLTASTEQPLDFGTLATNSGRQAIDFGSLNMGIFSITALKNEILLINLNKPHELYHENPATKETIPIELLSRYGYAEHNYQNTYKLSNTSSIIKVNPNSEPGPWNTIYIFMYGSVNIGNVPDGVYSNDIVLNVEYL